MAAHLQSATRYEIHAVLKQANYDLAKHQLNTVASAAMKILNAIEKLPGRTPAAQEGLSILLRLLSPITPHVCHHLWRALGFGEDVMTATWPEPDAAALVQDEIEYVVQVNGKLRGTVWVPASSTEEHTATLAITAVEKFIAGKPVRKRIVVPGRLVNIVV
jgi:leucyl-tRNA synthetase